MFLLWHAGTSQISSPTDLQTMRQACSCLPQNFCNLMLIGPIPFLCQGIKTSGACFDTRMCFSHHVWHTAEWHAYIFRASYAMCTATTTAADMYLRPSTQCCCPGCTFAPSDINAASYCRGIPCEVWTQYADVTNDTSAAYNVSFYFPVSQVGVLITVPFCVPFSIVGANKTLYPQSLPCIVLSTILPKVFY